MKTQIIVLYKDEWIYNARSGAVPRTWIMNQLRGECDGHIFRFTERWRNTFCKSHSPLHINFYLTFTCLSARLTSCRYFFLHCTFYFLQASSTSLAPDLQLSFQLHFALCHKWICPKRTPTIQKKRRQAFWNLLAFIYCDVRWINEKCEYSVLSGFEICCFMFSVLWIFWVQQPTEELKHLCVNYNKYQVSQLFLFLICRLCLNKRRDETRITQAYCLFKDSRRSIIDSSRKTLNTI